MPRRQIGQEQLMMSSGQPHGGTSLDELAGLIHWTELDRLLRWHLGVGQGRAGLAAAGAVSCAALSLATWHDLSDVRWAAALDDRASFRRFCGFAVHEPTPKRTAFVRFRAELVGRGLDRALFEAVTRQLDARGVVVRTGTLVDATLIASASVQRDDQAKWAGRRRKPALGQNRLTPRKPPKMADDEVALTAAIIDGARQYGRYGYRRITALLRAEGWACNHKRVERIWRREGLKVPARQSPAWAVMAE